MVIWPPALRTGSLACWSFDPPVTISQNELPRLRIKDNDRVGMAASEISVLETERGYKTYSTTSRLVSYGMIDRWSSLNSSESAIIRQGAASHIISLH